MALHLKHLILAMFFITTWPAAAVAESLVLLQVQQNSQVWTVGLPATLQGGVTYVPVRLLCQNLGIPLLWYPDTGSVAWAVYPGEIVITPGMDQTYLTQPEVRVIEVKHPAIRQGDKVLVPLRSLETAGASVAYNSGTGKITIYLPANFPGRPELPLGEGYRMVKSEIMTWLSEQTNSSVTINKPGWISGYTTRFNPDNKPRTVNLRLAAAALDGKKVLPGDIFSFNETVGPRWPSRGFQIATIYRNQEMVEDYGGGVCQVSTTLYNAVLDAGLTIVERHPHSLPVPYVPTGRDATVSYGVIDFRFKNGSTEAVQIHTAVVDNQLTIELYRAVEAN